MTLHERFDEFHAENPEVYRRLVEMARSLKKTGRERYGIASLFEALRWHIAMETKGDTFKCNNNFRAFYARLIMERESDLAGFFETREQKVAA